MRTPYNVQFHRFPSSREAANDVTLDMLWTDNSGVWLEGSDTPYFKDGECVCWGPGLFSVAWTGLIGAFTGSEVWGRDGTQTPSDFEAASSVWHMSRVRVDDTLMAVEGYSSTGYSMQSTWQAQQLWPSWTISYT